MKIHKNLKKIIAGTALLGALTGLYGSEKNIDNKIHQESADRLKITNTKYKTSDYKKKGAELKKQPAKQDLKKKNLDSNAEDYPWNEEQQNAFLEDYLNEKISKFKTSFIFNYRQENGLKDSRYENLESWNYFVNNNPDSRYNDKIYQSQDNPIELNAQQKIQLEYILKGIKYGEIDSN